MFLFKIEVFTSNAAKSSSSISKGYASLESKYIRASIIYPIVSEYSTQRYGGLLYAINLYEYFLISYDLLKKLNKNDVKISLVSKKLFRLVTAFF